MERIVDLAALEDDVEASLLDGILNERKIPHFMVSFWDVAYDGIFQFQHGWGVVRGPEEYGDEVRRLLTELREV